MLQHYDTNHVWYPGPKGWPVIGCLLSVRENLQWPFQNSQMLGGY